MSQVLAGFPGLHSDGTLLTLAYLVCFPHSSVLLSGFLKLSSFVHVAVRIVFMCGEHL